MLPCRWCSLKSHLSPVGSCLEVSAYLREGEPQKGPAVQVQHMSGSFLQAPGASLGKSSCTHLVQLPKGTWSLRLTMLPSSLPFWVQTVYSHLLSPTPAFLLLATSVSEPFFPQANPLTSPLQRSAEHSQCPSREAASHPIPALLSVPGAASAMPPPRDSLGGWTAHSSPGCSPTKSPQSSAISFPERWLSLGLFLCFLFVHSLPRASSPRDPPAPASLPSGALSMGLGARHGLMPADTCSSAGAAGWRGNAGGEGIVGGFIMKSSAGLGPSIVQVANK